MWTIGEQKEKLRFVQTPEVDGQIYRRLLEQIDFGGKRAAWVFRSRGFSRRVLAILKTTTHKLRTSTNPNYFTTYCSSVDGEIANPLVSRGYPETGDDPVSKRFLRIFFGPALQRVSYCFYNIIDVKKLNKLCVRNRLFRNYDPCSSIYETRFAEVELVWSCMRKSLLEGQAMDRIYGSLNPIRIALQSRIYLCR